MKNFDCVVLSFLRGSKHNRIDNLEDKGLETSLNEREVAKYSAMIDAGMVDRICIYKNPFSWIYSYRAAYGRGKLTDDQVIEWMQVYNEMNQHWQCHCYMVNYHELIKKPLHHLNLIQQHFGLSRIGFFSELKTATRRAPEVFGDDLLTHGKRKRDFDKNLYRKKNYMNIYTPRQIQIIKMMDTFYDNCTNSDNS